MTSVISQVQHFCTTVFVTAPSLYSSSPNASVRQTHVAVTRQDVLVKVAIQGFVDVMLQETQEKAENAGVAAAVTDEDFDELKAPETPEVYCLVVQRQFTAGIRLIVPL